MLRLNEGVWLSRWDNVQSDTVCVPDASKAPVVALRRAKFTTVPPLPSALKVKEKWYIVPTVAGMMPLLLL